MDVVKIDSKIVTEIADEISQGIMYEIDEKIMLHVISMLQERYFLMGKSFKYFINSRRHFYVF